MSDSLEIRFFFLSHFGCKIITIILNDFALFGLVIWNLNFYLFIGIIIDLMVNGCRCILFSSYNTYKISVESSLIKHKEWTHTHICTRKHIQKWSEQTAVVTMLSESNKNVRSECDNKPTNFMVMPIDTVNDSINPFFFDFHFFYCLCRYVIWCCCCCCGGGGYLLLENMLY